MFKSWHFRNCHQLMLCTYRKVGDVFRGLIPVAEYYIGVDVGLLLFTNGAVFPLLDTEFCVISSAEGQMFLLMEKVETSEGYDGYVLQDKVCSSLKTVGYDVSTVHCTILKKVVYSMLIKKGDLVLHRWIREECPLADKKIRCRPSDYGD